MFLNIFLNPKSNFKMKKINLLAVVLVAGFLYFLGSTLYSQTTFDDSKCKCCDETCTMTDCCKNCGIGSSQGNATVCCANCTSEKCKDCCGSATGRMHKDASSGTGSEQAQTSDASKNCCSKDGATSENKQNCCNKK
jgi:hypothetical protein